MSAGVLFLITGVAKLISGFGNSLTLLKRDPILLVQFGGLMIAVGALELVLACVCMLIRHKTLATVLIAWATTMILAYRLGLWWIGWQGPCHCLGSLTDAIHVSAEAADEIMKIVLSYILIGSYGILFHQWWKGRKMAVDGSELEG
jgi:hypothetical protein